MLLPAAFFVRFSYSCSMHVAKQHKLAVIYLTQVTSIERSFWVRKEW